MIKAKIITESLKVLILGSLLSSIGGFGLEFISYKFSILLPLIIILPALSGMIGNAGIIFVSKVTTYLDSGKIKVNKMRNKHTWNLFLLLVLIFSLSSFYATFLSILIGYIKGFRFEYYFIPKMMLVVLLTTLFILFFVYCAALIGGKYAYKRNIDPDDFLIPITTSVADLGSLIVFSLLVYFII